MTSAQQVSFPFSTTVRRVGRKVDVKFRLFTSSLRLKPSFFIIGTEKGGTSSLFWNMREHPNLVLPKTKELHFFQKAFERGLKWYHAQFPLSLTPQAMTGEATVDYLFLPYVARRIATVFPQAKLIVLLRDPVTRAYSEYHMNRDEGRHVDAAADEMFSRELAFLQRHKLDDANFQRFVYDWVAAFPTRWSYPLDEYQVKSSAGQSGVEAYPYWPYLLRGLYYPQLQVWFEHFPRDQFLIIKSEDYFANPRHFIENAVPSFLNIPTWQLPQYERTKQDTRSTQKAPSALSEELTRFFKPHNEKLYQLLDMDFGW